MKTTYSITINPSCFKKWDIDFVNMLLMEQQPNELWYYKNYNSLDYDDQRKLLRAIIEGLKSHLVGIELSDIRYEYTAKGNLHAHYYMVIHDDEKYDHDFFLESIRYMNKVFSSGLKYLAVHTEKTYYNVKFWDDYCNKQQWLNTITRENFPNEIF